jgi:hypothetical protein
MAEENPATLSYLSIGSVGTGFLESSLQRGLEGDIAFIGADAGSVDGGPNALSGLPPAWPDVSYIRDLSLLVRGALRAGVPLLVGSCATSGRDWGVDYFANLVRDIAAEHGLSFTLARIYTEVGPELVVERLKAGRVHPIEPAPEYTEEIVRRSLRITSVMGVEPFQAAVDAGADIILAGRATDTAIFAAIPLARGFDPGLVWHAAKIAECGTGATEPKRRLDVLHVEMRRDCFVVKPLADDIRCTPFSVSAHQLHEVADPFTMVEPGWTTDLSQVTYEVEDERSTRVTGARAWSTPYTVKLEGVERVGAEKMFMLAVRDPTILAAIDEWVAGIQSDIRTRCEELIGADGLAQCKTTVRVYGRNGIMGDLEPVKGFEGHEAFLLVSVTAPTAQMCAAATSVIWYAFLHAKSPGWRGGTTVAWPFSQATFDLGDAHRFNVHHAMEVDDPLETIRIEYEEVGR